MSHGENSSSSWARPRYLDGENVMGMFTPKKKDMDDWGCTPMPPCPHDPKAQPQVTRNKTVDRSEQARLGDPPGER